MSVADALDHRVGPRRNYVNVLREEIMDEKDEARDVTVDMQELKENLSPDAFHIYAGPYYKC
jgi:hypothetical protein